MSGVIDLSAGVRSNLLPLQYAADVMTQAQQRLSTGKNVNSAIDDPTNFFTAASLNNYAGDLGSLLDSIGGGASQPRRFLLTLVKRSLFRNRMIAG
jgi:flagellin